MESDKFEDPLNFGKEKKKISFNFFSSQRFTLSLSFIRGYRKDGLVLTDFRKRLDDESIESIIFINTNFNFFSEI